MDGYGYDGLDDEGFIINTDNSFSITYKESKPSGGINFEGLCDRVRTVEDTEQGKVKFTFSNIRSDIKLAYTEEYMEIGYYFYDDGNFGAEPKENAIGIIYKVGKHATDDIANYAGSKLEDNIRGYVVALKDEVNDEDDTFQWRTGTDSEGLSGDDYPENGVGDG